jgi:hypothetical protein
MLCWSGFGRISGSEAPGRSNPIPLGMVARREHGADQSRDHYCGHESANRLTDDLAAEAI